MDLINTISVWLLPLLFAITGLRMWQIRRAQKRALPDGLAAPAE